VRSLATVGGEQFPPQTANGLKEASRQFFTVIALGLAILIGAFVFAAVTL
jgi:hypothetical protein